MCVKIFYAKKRYWSCNNFLLIFCTSSVLILALKECVRWNRIVLYRYIHFWWSILFGLMPFSDILFVIFLFHKSSWRIFLFIYLLLFWLKRLRLLSIAKLAKYLSIYWRWNSIIFFKHVLKLLNLFKRQNWLTNNFFLFLSIVFCYY